MFNIYIPNFYIPDISLLIAISLICVAYYLVAYLEANNTYINNCSNCNNLGIDERGKGEEGGDGGGNGKERVIADCSSGDNCGSIISACKNTVYVILV